MSKAKQNMRWLLVGALLSACGSGGSDPGRGELCVPGQVQMCTCPSGEMLRNICTYAAAFGDCPCSMSPSNDGGQPSLGGQGGKTDPPGMAGRASPVDAGTSPDAVGGPGAAGQSDAAPVTPDASSAMPGCKVGELATGTDELLKVVVTHDGIIVAQPNLVRLFARDGSVKKTFTPPRPLTTVSSDGSYLAAADAARLNVLSLDLTSLGDVNLTEACADSVIVNNHVFVCGPKNDWDRVFYTYDLKSRQKIATSTQKYTYNGIPMRRVPGTNDFITVSGGSPSDFHLYQVSATGDVRFVGESPYHGDFDVTLTYGLVNTPATHVLNLDGLLLKIYSDKCNATSNSFNSGCFVKDGNIGTLAANQRYVGMGGDGLGTLYALVATGSDYAFDGICKTGCTLQTIDVAARQVTAQKAQTLQPYRVISLDPDVACKTAVAGYTVPAQGGASSNSAGFKVEVLAL